MNWLHKLLNPHCKDCRDAAREAKECHNCDVLTQLLERERATNAKLIDQLTAPKVVEKIVERPDTNRKPIRAVAANWDTRRQLLESEDRARAEILRKHGVEPDKSTDTIEEELGVKNG